MRRRHRNKYEETELNITAFLNLMVILIPFLLVTAVFSRITTLHLQIPPLSEIFSKPPESPTEVPLQLNVIVRTDMISVATNKDGLIGEFPRNDAGFDFKGISELLQNMKDRIPDHKAINLLLEPNVSYETIVTAMDTVRLVELKNEGRRIQTELFPDISFGDAPLRQEPSLPKTE